MKLINLLTILLFSSLTINANPIPQPDDVIVTGQENENLDSYSVSDDNIAVGSDSYSYSVSGSVTFLSSNN
jgi:hypothetical protein